MILDIKVWLKYLAYDCCMLSRNRKALTWNHQLLWRFRFQEYELREYEASQWVTTNMKGMDYNNAIYPMFMRLFQYISGQNDRSERPISKVV